MAKLGPKEKVAEAVRIVYPDANIEVRGTRVKGRFGGQFLAEVNVNNNTLARCSHRDWRSAYKSLEIEFAKHWID